LLLPEVVDLHIVKSINRQLITKAARNSGAIITVEDHKVTGALGSAVSDIIGEILPVRVFGTTRY